MIQGVIEILSDNVDLVALVGMNKAATKPKIYWVVCPDQEQAPYVILRISGNNPNQVKNQVSSVDSVSFEAYTYGTSPEQTDEIDTALRFAAEGRNITTDTVFFQRIFCVGQSDGYDKDAQKPFRVTSYTAMVQRTIPT